VVLEDENGEVSEGMTGVPRPRGSGSEENKNANDNGDK
jgi:hypothetical protein